MMTEFHEMAYEEPKERYAIMTVVEHGRQDKSATVWVHYGALMNGWAIESPSRSTMMFEMENYDGQ